MVYATIPEQLARGRRATCRPIGFLAHVDTSPAVSGDERQADHASQLSGRRHRAAGRSVAGDHRRAESRCSTTMIGDDIITTDGTTLLGSDDKAGVATIMTLVDMLLQNPDDRARPDRDRRSRPTRRSAAASRSSTSRASAPSSPTRSTAASSARSATRRGARGWRRSRSTARARIPARRRA